MSESKTALSILILSLVERRDQLRTLLSALEAQIETHEGQLGDSVEILVDLDNGKRSISAKRNNLLQLAKGEYLCFIDDDDAVSDDFVESLSGVIKSKKNTDCITFNQTCNVESRKFTVSFGLGNPITSEDCMLKSGGKILYRPPYHMCGFKSSIAKRISFSEARNIRGKSVEDIEWLLRLYPYLNSEYKIPKILHHYQYSSQRSRS